MKSQVLHTVWCNISGGAAGEIRNWSLLGVKGLNSTAPKHWGPRLVLVTNLNCILMKAGFTCRSRCDLPANANAFFLIPPFHQEGHIFWWESVQPNPTRGNSSSVKLCKFRAKKSVHTTPCAPWTGMAWVNGAGVGSPLAKNRWYVDKLLDYWLTELLGGWQVSWLVV